ncbi:MAG TPA: EamA family transporter [Woeseiaceae bacterium]|nr:EamA family transporter [Woeseiaceae bacterium]
MSNGLLYLITVLVWGSTWLAIEFQLGVVAPEVSVFYRYCLAALMIFGWCRARGLNLRFDRRAHGRFLLLGLLLFCLNYILTYYAQQYITSALTAIAFSTMLWMNIVNARIFFGVRSGPRVIAGSMLGIAGIITLFLPQIGSLSLTDATLYGAGLCVLAAFVASLGNMASQAAQKGGLPVVQANAWGMFYGALFTGAIALVQGHEFNFDSSVGYVVSLTYLAVFGSVVAFGAYLTLLGRIGAHKAGYAVVMFPVVALVLSVLFEGLQITANLVAGVILVTAGNIVILRRERAAVPPDDARDDGQLPLGERTA